jgi:hypothetical protein
MDADGVKIVRTETAHDRGVRIAKDAMREYHVALEQLAKS